MTPFDHEAFSDLLDTVGCPHDELDHGVCLECGKDCWDDVVASAEFAADCREDR